MAKIKGRRKLEFKFHPKNASLVSIIRFNLYILHILILTLLKRFVGLPQHHQPGQILPNRHWGIAPQSHFGLSNFWYFTAPYNYKFFIIIITIISSLILLNTTGEALCYFTTIGIEISNPPFGIGDLQHLTSLTLPSSRPP